MAKIDIPLMFNSRPAYKVPWVDIDVQPVKKDGDTFTKCEIGDPELYCWSVYLVRLDGESQCVADLPTKNLAFDVAQLIKYASKSKVKK